MKRLALYIFAILNLVSTVFGQQAFNPSEESRLPCEILVHFYQLWSDSGFGQDPNRTERSAWIIRHSDGDYECRRWPRLAARNKEVWKGPVPDNTIAQVHTHTVVVDPKPSTNDRTFASKTHAVLYTISDKGIWKVTPEGTVTKEADQDWWRGVDSKQCQ